MKVIGLLLLLGVIATVVQAAPVVEQTSVDQYAYAYTYIMDLWNSSLSGYWTTFLNDYWPAIEPWVSKKWVLPTVGIVAAVGNQVWVQFSQVGTNQIAVAATIAKSVLRDQEVGGGWTLYMILDKIIEITAK